MRTIPWTAAILAGGEARRLGRIDKSALVVGTASILERQLAVLRGLTPHILIVTSDRHGVRPAPPGVRVVTDLVPAAGALGGLYTALMEATTDQVLVIGCDMPFLTAAFVTCVVERGREADVAVPRDERGRHPLCASYARRTAAHFRARIEAGELRVGDALQGLAVRELGPDELAPFNRDGRLLLNINTPDDYARARLAAADGDDSTPTRKDRASGTPLDSRVTRPERTPE
ncbi:MAG: molybdenum cofactor guanylyltransferase [Acidobacteria bacterium]|nr:molybdenum cofactor guanylyltransferase [Acidobacteriota bacterium]